MEDDLFDDEYSEDDSADVTVRDCPECGAEIYDDTPRCPACGEYIPDAVAGPMPRWMLIGITAALAAMIGSTIFIYL